MRADREGKMLSFRPWALGKTDPGDMQSSAYHLVCGVQEYAESRRLGFGSRE